MTANENAAALTGARGADTTGTTSDNHNRKRAGAQLEAGGGIRHQEGGVQFGHHAEGGGQIAHQEDTGTMFQSAIRAEEESGGKIYHQEAGGEILHQEGTAQIAQSDTRIGKDGARRLSKLDSPPSARAHAETTCQIDKSTVRFGKNGVKLEAEGGLDESSSRIGKDGARRLAKLASPTLASANLARCVTIASMRYVLPAAALLIAYIGRWS